MYVEYDSSTAYCEMSVETLYYKSYVRSTASPKPFILEIKSSRYLPGLKPRPWFIQKVTIL